MDNHNDVATMPEEQPIEYGEIAAPDPAPAISLNDSVYKAGDRFSDIGAAKWVTDAGSKTVIELTDQHGGPAGAAEVEANLRLYGLPLGELASLAEKLAAIDAATSEKIRAGAFFMSALYPGRLAPGKHFSCFRGFFRPICAGKNQHNQLNSSSPYSLIPVV